MRIIGNNKYFDALKKLIMFSAIVHISLLVIYSIIKFEMIHINYFNILDLDLFFPNIIYGPFSLIFSIITMIIIYFIFYFEILKKK